MLDEQKNDMQFYTVLYKKHFDFREQAEKYIAKHKKQNCFCLTYTGGRLPWCVEKSRPSTPAEIDNLLQYNKKQLQGGQYGQQNIAA